MDSRPRQQILTLVAIALTFGSGANDVASFTRLGGVFTSVMTGNIVLWGLSAAERSVSLFSHTAVSIAGYITGVACGTWVAHGFKVHGSAKPDETDRDSVLPAHVSWALFTELVLLAGFTVGWEVTGARPAGWAEFVLLGVLAAAMGMQSSSVNEMGLTNVSTTFLTGTLTGLVSSLASPGQGTKQGARRIGVLIGLATGALLCGLLVATAPRVVPVLPLAAVITALVLSAVPLSNEEEDESRARLWVTLGYGATSKSFHPAVPGFRNFTTIRNGSPTHTQPRHAKPATHSGKTTLSRHLCI